MREVLKVEAEPCLHTHYWRSELQGDRAELRGELGGTDEFAEKTCLLKDSIAIRYSFSITRLSRSVLPLRD